MPRFCKYQGCHYFSFSKRRVHYHELTAHSKPKKKVRGRHMDSTKKRNMGQVEVAPVVEEVKQLVKKLLTSEENTHDAVLLSFTTEQTSTSIYAETMLQRQSSFLSRAALEVAIEDNNFELAMLKKMANFFKPADDLFEVKERSRPGTPDTSVIAAMLGVSPTPVPAPSSSSWFGAAAPKST